MYSTCVLDMRPFTTIGMRRACAQGAKSALGTADMEPPAGPCESAALGTSAPYSKPL